MLETLRAKPDHIKKTIALTTTSVIFGVVLFVWWSSFDARKNEEQSRAQAVSPILGLASVLEGVTSEIKASYSSATSFEEDMGASVTGSITKASSTAAFDTSSVVVIDAASPLVGTSSVATTTTQ